jgi:hypothetical protein
MFVSSKLMDFDHSGGDTGLDLYRRLLIRFLIFITEEECSSLEESGTVHRQTRSKMVLQRRRCGWRHAVVSSIESLSFQSGTEESRIVDISNNIQYRGIFPLGFMCFFCEEKAKVEQVLDGFRNLLSKLWSD